MIVLLQTSWSGSDRSYCRTSPGSSGVQLECLMKPKLIGCIHFFALREKQNKTRLSPRGRKNKKQSSCGFGLAQHKDRQNKWTNVDLQKKKKNMGKRVLTWIFTADVVLVRTDVGGLPSCHACKTPASYQLTPANKPPRFNQRRVASPSWAAVAQQP